MRMSFGELVRRRRTAKEIGLRELARKIGMSATYLSKIERGELPPPAEEKVRAIAEAIQCDAETLLARSGRVPSHITNIIRRRPVEVTALLHKVGGLSVAEIAKLVEYAERLKEERLAAKRGDFESEDFLQPTGT